MARRQRPYSEFRIVCSCLILITLSTSCGWRLRGMGTDASNLPPVYLGGEDPRFNSALSQAFDKLGFRLMEIQQAPWEINIIKHSYSRRLSAVNQSGQATSFLLSLSIQFQILKKGEDQNNLTQVVTASQDILYDQTAVLGKDAEESQIHESLLSDAAQQITHRFRAAVKK